MHRRSQLVAAAVLAAITLVACGDDDSGGDAAPTGDAPVDGLVVVAEDIGFLQDTYETEAGSTTFVYENDGSIVHTLLIEDVDGFELEVSSNGDTDTGDVDLEAGEYVLYCDVPGHRQAGMEATLVVS